MTQVKKEQRRSSTKESGRQPQLPLADKTSLPSSRSNEKLKSSASAAIPNSKLIFQLKSELHRLQQRDREWKLMFGMLSHDLKEPLLTLEGFTKLLDQSGIEGKDQKRYLKVIREAVSSLHTLVGSMQSITRLSQESTELSEIHLIELMDQALMSLQDKIERTKARIVLPKRDLVFKGDPVRLFQIFLNLISNSLRYHKNEEAPLIEIFHRSDSDFHRISIRDNGVGMHAQDLKKLFAPFTKLEDVPSDGLGIGLSIVKRIAESFGGRILVRSQHGVGTTFTVCLPKRIGGSKS